MPRRSPTADPEALRALVQRFVRLFGLLADEATPCGQPLRTSQAHALMVLRAAGDEGQSQAALATELGIDKSNVSRMVRQLAQKGHVTISAAPADARVRRVCLTPKGARLAARLDGSSRARFAALLEDIEPAQRAGVMEGLAQLVRAIERSPRPS